MKLKALFVVLFVAGLVASIAVASPPPGKGKNAGTATTAGATTTTAKAAKVLVCHKTGHKNQYVILSVSAKSAHARLKHGDVLAVGGACPGPIQGHTGTTTTETTTTNP